MPVSRKRAAVDMTHGSPVRLILQFTLPMLVGQLLQQVYLLSDTMITGHFIGDSAIAAIGASTPLHDLMVNFATGMGNGCGILISQLYGAGRMDRLRKATAVMLMICVLLGVGLTLVMVLCMEPLLRLLNTPESVFSQALGYARIVCGGVAVTILYNMCASFMRALGNARMPLVALMIACVLNLVLDVVFVIGLHAGVAGTGLATLIAQGVSALVSIAYILRALRPFLPRREDFRAPGALWRAMASSGLSMGLMNSVYSFGNVTMQSAINGIGEAAMTAHTSAKRILNLTGAPMANLGAAGAVFISQNYGAHRFERVRTGIRRTLTMVFLWEGLATIAMFTLGPQLLRLLIGTTNPDILRYGTMTLQASATMFFPLAYLVTIRQAMQSMGMHVAPVISSSIELVVKVVAAFLVVPRFGYAGACWVEPSTWLLCCLFLMVIYAVRRRDVLHMTKERGGRGWKTGNDGT